MTLEPGKDKRDERLRTWRQEHEQEQRQRCSAVVAEFDAGDSDATLQAMAGAILEYRPALGLLAASVSAARAGRDIQPACSVTEPTGGNERRRLNT
jgi:hypothetical protein